MADRISTPLKPLAEDLTYSGTSPPSPRLAPIDSLEGLGHNLYFASEDEMTHDPHDYDQTRDLNNPEPLTEPTEFYPEEEAYILHKEEQRLATARRRSVFDWITNSIYLLVSSLEVLLGIRFFLRLTGANPDNTFAQFIYQLSEPFASPFSTLFISPTAKTSATIGVNIFDINLLIGMAIYSLLGLLAVRLVRFFEGR